ncbi:MAG: type II secretion system F family protein [Syntrophobacteria bacterium]
MPTYRYKARDSEGQAVTGVLTGRDKEAVAGQIIQLGYVPVGIEVAPPEKKKTGHSRYGFRRVKREELIYFSRQLSLVLSAGVPLLSGLHILASQVADERMRRTLQALAESIEAGATLSEAMSAHPLVFSHLYINMIRAGEASGALDETLRRLAELGEYEMENRARVQEATRYPKLVVGALVIAFFVVVYFVIPNFARLFGQMGAALPLPTRLMLSFNEWLQQYWLPSLMGLGIVIGFLLWWLHTGAGRYWFDRFKVTVPVFGPLMTKFVLSRFSKIFAILNSSGLPILTTLELSAETIGNLYYTGFLQKVKGEVKGGQDLAGSLERTGVFPLLLVRMVAVGETSGALDEVLTKVSEYYDQDVDFALKRLSTLLEPVLLCMLAGFVFFMALAVFLPMWNMASVMMR